MKKIKNINWKRVIASLTIFSLACGGIYFAMNKIQASCSGVTNAE